MTKETGRSWIDPGKIGHSFYSRNHSYPEGEKDFANIIEPYERIKTGGIAPDLGFILQDVDDKQRNWLQDRNFRWYSCKSSK